MNKIVKFFTLLTLCCPIVACGDYLDTSTPENADDGFVTSTASETFKYCLGVTLTIARTV